jgi:hypothetical protein
MCYYQIATELLSSFSTYLIGPVLVFYVLYSNSAEESFLIMRVYVLINVNEPHHLNFPLAPGLKKLIGSDSIPLRNSNPHTNKDIRLRLGIRFKNNCFSQYIYIL